MTDARELAGRLIEGWHEAKHREAAALLISQADEIEELAALVHEGGTWEQQLAEKDREIERLREALKPFAAFADQIDEWRHEDDSTCTHRIKASDLRRARKEVGMKEPEPSEVSVRKMRDEEWR
jgi:hypothetical protein